VFNSNTGIGQGGTQIFGPLHLTSQEKTQIPEDTKIRNERETIITDPKDI
jgi:hypothetical protein